VLTAGAVRDASALLRHARAAAVMDQLRAAYDLVVLDAPPALALADAGRLASLADAVVLVVRAGETPREAVRLAVDTLQERLVGIVLNGVEEPGYARYLRNEAVGV
jgi:Mrp family chromosome partitioning ATPase